MVKRKRSGLWTGRWSDPQTGQRGKRATRRELAEAYRLWAAHKDIRLGKGITLSDEERAELQPVLEELGLT